MEHARHHLGYGEIRTQCLVIEIEVFLTAFLRPIRNFPWLQRLAGFTSLLCFVSAEFAIILTESTNDAIVQIFDERQRRCTIFRHTALQYKIGEMLLSEDFRLLLSQLKNAPDES